MEVHQVTCDLFSIAEPIASKASDILTAFTRAAICQPPPGLLVHADRGSQYPSDAFTALLDRTQAIVEPASPTWKRPASN
ncbi:hypothetical protein GKZ68_20660 (plasmid) [Hymenobacter sp. BRD128]|uniref:hypothetical protein n=1 Tax=Hymenobacter sp. BRD128 TaxID=2675878 RepID=UPI0015659D5C|nr:hypothetical protein [Hymenobacter sp. BRD128]QKG59096.1 hypothetical protein GKZ68_20660 [Hymenobacter sp. BRD128]